MGNRPVKHSLEQNSDPRPEAPKTCGIQGSAAIYVHESFCIPTKVRTLKLTVESIAEVGVEKQRISR